MQELLHNNIHLATTSTHPADPQSVILCFQGYAVLWTEKNGSSFGGRPQGKARDWGMDTQRIVRGALLKHCPRTCLQMMFLYEKYQLYQAWIERRYLQGHASRRDKCL